MKEALFILLVLAVIAALTAYRYRRGIRAFLEFWKMVRSVRERNQSHATPAVEGRPNAGSLVNCPRCGKWVSENEALRLGTSKYYCSTKCLEAGTKVGA